MEAPTKDTLNAVWGISGECVFAVGNRGTILRFDGNSWTRVKSGTRKRLYAVWGIDENNVYAVGDDAVHFDGEQWKQINLNSEPTYFSIWGSAADDIYVGCDDGRLAHFDGADWKLVNTGVNDAITYLTGTSPDHVIGGGGDIGDGFVVIGSGEEWEEERMEDWPVAVWGKRSNDLFAADWSGAILHCDGRDRDDKSWRRIHEYGGGNLTAIWGSSPDNVLVAGLSGTLIRQRTA
jgi:hypothetical protein